MSWLRDEGSKAKNRSRLCAEAEQTRRLRDKMFIHWLCVAEAVIISIVSCFPALHRQLKMEPEKQNKQTVYSSPAGDMR